MVGSESSWALGRSQAALNARALGLFSAQGADGKPIFYGSKVAFEEDQDVPFSVVGWAVAQAAPVAVIEQFNKVGLHPADTLMLANPERLVSIERHEALEGAGHWEFLRAHREERADGAWRAEIERLERESAAYEAQAMEGKEAARPLGAVDERARGGGGCGAGHGRAPRLRARSSAGEGWEAVPGRGRREPGGRPVRGSVGRERRTARRVASRAFRPRLRGGRGCLIAAPTRARSARATCRRAGART